jgi:transposase
MHGRVCRDCYNRAASPPLPPELPPLFDEPRAKHLPLVHRAAIVTLHKDGQPRGLIAKKMRTSAASVRRWIGRYEEKKEVSDEQRSGRPRATSEEQDTNMCLASRVDPFASPRTIKHQLDLDVSEDTIARRLDEAGLHARVARQQFQLSGDHKRQRLSFAEGYSRWSEDDWRRVFFADETLFLGSGSHGKAYVRREDGTRDEPEHCIDKRPHPTQVAAWGCFSAAGPGYMRMFDGSLNAAGYRDILRDYLLPTAEEQFEDGKHWWLLHDNASTHKAPVVKKLMHDRYIRALQFPPYSPDLNPIENLWADMKKRVEKRATADKDELEDIVGEEWAATPAELCSKLASSMTKRIAQCIEREGAYTDH